MNREAPEFEAGVLLTISRLSVQRDTFIIKAFCGPTAFGWLNFLNNKNTKH
jgi:hypothetical protein